METGFSSGREELPEMKKAGTVGRVDQEEMKGAGLGLSQLEVASRLQGDKTNVRTEVWPQNKLDNL